MSRTTYVRFSLNFSFLNPPFHCSWPALSEMLVGHHQALAQLKCLHSIVEACTKWQTRESESAMATQCIVWTENMETRLIELWQQHMCLFHVFYSCFCTRRLSRHHISALSACLQTSVFRLSKTQDSRRKAFKWIFIDNHNHNSRTGERGQMM